MSTINTTTLQADTLVAQDGDATKEVSIPSLDKKMAFAKAIFYPPDGILSTESFNVSSFVRLGGHVYALNLINGRVGSDGQVAFAVTANGRDAVTNDYLDIFHAADQDT